ncbi:MAG: GNAT family N-acetyltransferase [Gammaproteobacteria bacterium]|nr:GNAT family N-acetyltransferase [Gammaproteobacteria bacterium]
MDSAQDAAITGSNMVISMRSMSEKELEMVFTWSAREGWNPGKYETAAFYAINPSGYTLLTINNVPAACLLSVRYTNKYAFMALYIVKPEFRGKGFGKMLWDKVMHSLADCETVGFSGVLERVEDYKKAGFKPYFFDMRWYGKPKFSDKQKGVTNNIVLKKITEIPFMQLVDYDAKIFAIQRENFLAKWIEMPLSFASVAINDMGEICGYGVICTSAEGYKVAPLYADSELIAEELLRDLCNSVSHETTIFIDTPEINSCAVDLVKRLGLQEVFKTMRMYRGLPLPTQDEKMFGLTGLELG